MGDPGRAIGMYLLALCLASLLIGAAAQCGGCANTAVSPVCARVPGAAGLGITVASACWAKCQGLEVLSQQSCESVAVSALAASSQQPAAAAASAAAAGLSAAGVAMAAGGGARAPRFSADCRVSDRVLQTMGRRGSILQGCLPRQPSPPDTTTGTDKIQTPPMSKGDSLQELLKTASAGDQVVVKQLDYMAESGAVFVALTATTKSAFAATSTTPQQTVLSVSGAAPAVVAAAGDPQLSTPAADPAAATGRRLQQQQPISWCIADASQQGVSPDPCGRTAVSQAETATMPYKGVVQLRWTITNSGTFQCSGAVISPDDVLTAAHCLADMDSTANPTPYGPWNILAGLYGTVAAGGSRQGVQGTFWNIWVGAGGFYNVDPARRPGSVTLDIGLIRLATPFDFWLPYASVPPAPACGQVGTLSLMSCGYPADQKFDYPWCDLEGTSDPIDLCDATTDFVTSKDMKISPGNSGGPLFWKKDDAISATNPIIGVVSGAYSDASSFFYGALDTFNLPLVESTTTGNTLWSYSWSVRATRGRIRRSSTGACLVGTTSSAGVTTTTCSSLNPSNQMWVRPNPTRASPNKDLRMCTTVSSTTRCLVARNATSVGLQLLSTTNAADPAVQWFVDRRGWMRTAKYATTCLTSSSTTGTSANITLSPCVTNGTAAGNIRKVWFFQDVATARTGH